MDGWWWMHSSIDSDTFPTQSRDTVSNDHLDYRLDITSDCLMGCIYLYIQSMRQTSMKRRTVWWWEHLAGLTHYLRWQLLLENRFIINSLWTATQCYKSTLGSHSWLLTTKYTDVVTASDFNFILNVILHGFWQAGMNTFWHFATISKYICSAVPLTLWDRWLDKQTVGSKSGPDFWFCVCSSLLKWRGLQIFYSYWDNN